MNSKTVLNKIMQMLSLTEETFNFTDAKSADGSILQSPTFDLGEPVEVVSEDGTKTPAPDGEHQVVLKDSEGKDVIIRVVTKDGIITERENVEEAQPEAEVEMADADAEMIKTKKLPSTGNEDPENVMPDVENSVTSGTQKMEETTLPVGPLPQTEEAPNQAGEETNMGNVVKQMEDMAYRIEEMTARIMKCEEAMLPPVDQVVNEEVAMAIEDEELPKLDGAPVEDASAIHKFNTNRKNYGEKMVDAQSTFLSKLYN